MCESIIKCVTSTDYTMLTLLVAWLLLILKSPRIQFNPFFAINVTRYVFSSVKKIDLSYVLKIPVR